MRWHITFSVEVEEETEDDQYQEVDRQVSMLEAPGDWTLENIEPQRGGVKANPRGNAEDAYAAFMSMPEKEWQGLLQSILRGGTLEPEEHKGFERALQARKVGT